MAQVPDISVIIPAYNVEDYVTECLESVSRQTSEISVECIIVDDKSTDSTLSRINEFVDNYGGHVDFKVLMHSENQGQGVARNTALDVARGEYVFFLDADDTLTDDAFRMLMTHILLHPGVDMVVGSMTCRPRNPKFEKQINLSRFREIDYLDSSNEIMKIAFKMSESVTSALFRREILESNKLRFIDTIKFEDLHYVFKLYPLIRTLAVCHHPIYRYSLREGSTIQSMSVEREVADRLTLYEDLVNNHYQFERISLSFMVKCLGNLSVLINSGASKYRQRYLAFVEEMRCLAPRRCRPVFSYLKLPRPVMRGFILRPLTKIFIS